LALFSNRPVEGAGRPVTSFSGPSPPAKIAGFSFVQGSEKQKRRRDTSDWNSIKGIAMA